MFDIKDKLALKNKIKDKIEGERPLSLSFYWDEWKKEWEVRAKDDGSITLFIDWDEAWVIWQESFLFFVEAYMSKCLNEYDCDEEDEEIDEKKEEIEEKIDSVEVRKKELASMMLNKATR